MESLTTGRQGNLVIHRLLSSDESPEGYLAWFFCCGDCDHDLAGQTIALPEPPEWLE